MTTSNPAQPGRSNPAQPRRSNPAQVARVRLGNLLLGTHPHTDATAVTEWLGALQAQDLSSCEWSLGARLPGSTRSDVDRAITEGRVLRTWPMRGTLHLVPAVDAGWMLASTGRLALNGVKRRWQNLGLDEQTANRAAEILQAALAGGHRLTRSEALQTLTDSGIDTSGQRGYHFIWFASQIGVTCLGPNVGREQTIVLLADWAPHQVTRDPDDALRELALRFVRSHGPVSTADFARWTGLGVRAARRAITANDDAVTTVATTDGSGEPQWQGREPLEPFSGALVLPGFDEFILGYKDRSAMVDPQFQNRLVPGGNGVFRATIVVDGQVRGTWRRTRRRSAEVIEVESFAPLSVPARKALNAAFAGYGRFLDRAVTVNYV
ncbi:MAG: winged helix DNA-binding domain-containing protein [Candidatus Nanopelagicales bacterium]